MFALGEIKKYSWTPRERAVTLLRKGFADVAEDYPQIPLHARTVELSTRCIQEIEGLFGEDWHGIIGDKGYFPWPPPSMKRFPAIEEALEVFPNLRVLFLYRHPLDTFTSLAIHARRIARDAKARSESDWYDPHKNPDWHPVWSANFHRHSLGWIEAMERWEKIQRSCSSLTLRYEDLRDDPETLLGKITDFLGVGPPGRMLAKLHKRASFGHIGYWKREYPRMVNKVDPKLFEVMERYGYSA